MDKFWLENISVLYKNNNYLHFFPTMEMTRIEQLNAITRLCIYYIVLLVLFKQNRVYLGLPIIIIILTLIIYFIYKNDEKGKYEDFINKKLLKKEKNITKFQDILEAGYYDSNGKLVLGKKYNIDEQKLLDAKAKDFVNYDYNEILEYQKQASRKPTDDNPFMNIPVTDLGKEDVPIAAANADDEDIKDNIERGFNADLYRDINDLYDTKNSQRVWYTTPVTSIPNDQEGFSKWLYKVDRVCKNDQFGCLRYEDLRFKRFL